MKIAPGIHLIPGTIGGRPLQLSLLVGSERVVLLDTGCAGDPQGFLWARAPPPYCSATGRMLSEPAIFGAGAAQRWPCPK